MRAVGHNTQAAVYAGISPKKNIILAMVISGALAGMLGVNEILGVHTQYFIYTQHTRKCSRDDHR